MKLITAEQARGLGKPDDDKISKVIRAINTQVHARAGLGHTNALIGYLGRTHCFSALSQAEQLALKEALENCGYSVEAGPASGLIRVDWSREKEE